MDPSCVDPAGPGAFDVPSGVVYLNSASLAPRLKVVQKAGIEALAATARPWDIQARDWFEPVRALEASFAQLIGAAPAAVTLVSSVSYGVAVAAKNVPFPPGSNIVVLDREYPSNYYSWRELARRKNGTVRLASRRDHDLTAAILDAIDGDTAVVAVPQCRWTDGALLDLHRIGKAARRQGAALVVDASQSIGALPFDLSDVQPDFLLSVGYKWLLGPYGLAYLYAHERWQENGRPIEESWFHRAGSDNFAGLVDYTDKYAPGAARFGGGASAHFHLVGMAEAALSTIHRWTPAAIQSHLAAWTNEAVQRLGNRIESPTRRVGHMVGITPKHPLPPSFDDRMRAAGVHVGLRGGCIRVAPHLHSTEDDLGVFLDAFEASLRGDTAQLANARPSSSARMHGCS